MKGCLKCLMSPPIQSLRFNLSRGRRGVTFLHLVTTCLYSGTMYMYVPGICVCPGSPRCLQPAEHHVSKCSFEKCSSDFCVQLDVSQDEQDGDAALPSGGAEARNGRASAKSRRASARYPCGPDVASKAVLQHHEGCMEAVRTHHSFVLPRRAG